MGEDDGQGAPLRPFGIAVIIVSLAAVILMIYNCVYVRWFNRHNSLSPSHREQFAHYQEDQRPSGLENSFIQLIPAHKYGEEARKSGEGEKICSVCLCEFKEGEDVRRLPDCLHSFHVPCNDMWLYSHSNCPLCCAEMTPSPVLPLQRLPPGPPPASSLLSHIWR